MSFNTKHIAHVALGLSTGSMQRPLCCHGRAPKTSTSSPPAAESHLRCGGPAAAARLRPAGPCRPRCLRPCRAASADPAETVEADAAGPSCRGCREELFAGIKADATELVGNTPMVSPTGLAARVERLGVGVKGWAYASLVCTRRRAQAPTSRRRQLVVVGPAQVIHTERCQPAPFITGHTHART